MIVYRASCEAKALNGDGGSAFHQVGIIAHQRRWGVVEVEPKRFVIDSQLAMGLIPSTDIWGSLMNFIRHLVTAIFVGVILRSWVDDLVFIAEPSALVPFPILEASIFAMLHDLGVLRNPSKTLSFSHHFPFFGFIWNLKTKYVHLSLKKCEKYLAELIEFTTTAVQCQLEPLERLTSFLSHCCYVVKDGRFHLVELYKFQAGFRGFYRTRHVFSTESDTATYLVNCVGGGTTFMEKIGYALKDFHLWASVEMVPDDLRCPMDTEVQQRHISSIVSSFTGCVDGQGGLSCSGLKS